MPNVYVTEQGDKWDLIAFKQLGDTRHVNKLMAANTELLEYYIFPAGIELQLPKITLEQASLSHLPPWRQEV